MAASGSPAAWPAPCSRASPDRPRPPAPAPGPRWSAAAIGSIVLPAMVQQGFPKRFGAGVITTSGALGILIPPSIVMVIFAVATGGSVGIGPDGNRLLSASVGPLFMAGVVPGAILASMLGAATVYRAWKNALPRRPR